MRDAEWKQSLCCRRRRRRRWTRGFVTRDYASVNWTTLRNRSGDLAGSAATEWLQWYTALYAVHRSLTSSHHTPPAIFHRHMRCISQNDITYAVTMCCVGVASNSNWDLKHKKLEKEKQEMLMIRYSKKSKTRCSAIAERPRCRVRYSFRQK